MEMKGIRVNADKKTGHEESSKQGSDRGFWRTSM